MLNVGSHKQLLIDNRFFARSERIELTVNPPACHQIVMESETPWESYRVFFTSIVDSVDQLKMYYKAMSFDEAGRPANHLCLAVSDDGLHWRRPELGLYEFHGSKKNNIIAPFIDGAPHYDPSAPIAEPYVMVGTLSGMFDPDGLKPPEDIANPTKLVHLKDPVFGLSPNKPHLFTSPDGIRWQPMHKPLADFACDNWSNQIFYDHRLGSFVSYLRGFPGRRTVHRYETDDPTMTPWVNVRPDAKPDGYGCVYLENELPIAYDVDTEERSFCDVQNPAVVPYSLTQDVYLAFPGLHRYYPGPQTDSEHFGAQHRYRFFNDGVDDIHLFVSRDGIHWQRHTRQPYVGLGLWGEYNGGCLFSGLGLVQRKSELYQYYTASRRTHGAVDPADRNVMRICLARQRLDGFVSADADHSGGEFTTPPLTFQGDRLSLNIGCSALGEAKVEIQNPDGTPLPKYRLDDCDPIDLNHIAVPVTWKNKSDISALQHTPIKLRFSLRSSRLYAFQFASR